MNDRTTRFALALLLTAAAGAPGVAQEPESARTANAGVLITVALDTLGGAQVREAYAHVGDTLTHRPRFQWLARPCAEIGDIQLTDARGRVVLAPASHGVWVKLDDAVLATRGAPIDSFTVDYRVQGGGARGTTRDIPLVLPSFPIPRSEGAREGSVTVRVLGTTRDESVRFPQLARSANGEEWSGRFVAIPSFVRIVAGSDAGAPCVSEPVRGDDGGLVWRFSLLVGILVAWVPLYLWWARRATSADA